MVKSSGEDYTNTAIRMQPPKNVISIESTMKRTTLDRFALTPICVTCNAPWVSTRATGVHCWPIR